MNVIAISGRLTAHPELKTTHSGKSVCRFTVAVPEGKEKTHFLPCVAWGEKAEFVAKHFIKGQRMEVEGALTMVQWKDKNDQKRTGYEIVCRRIDFGEPKRDTAVVDEELTTEEDMDLLGNPVPF